MANRTWRNELNNRSYGYAPSYGAPITYNQNFYDDRRNFSARGGYQEDTRRGKRVYDNFDISPKKNERDNYQNPVRRNYNQPAIVAPKKPVNKYSVKPPKVTLDLKEASISVLRSRYPKLYLPSDFFHSDLRWQDVFPLYAPLSLGNTTKFQLFHRDVEPLTPFDNERLNPVDSNYTYSAKVMILESMDMDSLIKTVCEDSGNETKSIFKSLNFLVASKSKNEPLAIGGAWSPSLDGPNPDEDPQVLINTAIRTCKELTAIDLTPCKEWYRFVEYHYYRPVERQGLTTSIDNDDNRTESENNFRVETVVIFVPSVWDCMLNNESWEDIKTKYSAALDQLLMPPLPEPAVEIMDSEDNKKDDAIEIVSEILSEEITDENKTDVGDTAEKVEAAEIKKVSEPIIEVKELSEKDKKRLEQLYKMNESPSIVVHANTSAKGGKFQCQFMSLASLLEYRSDDQKEHTFEVSMFAEQFQEMILRDAGFNIYKSLLKMPKQNIDKGNNESDAKRRREEIDFTSDKCVMSTKIDSDLLLSFCVFDTDRANYIKDYDLEDILQSIGLAVSRSQIKKVITKVTNQKNSIYYRDLSMTQDGGDVESHVMQVVVSDMDLCKGNKPMIATVSGGTGGHVIYLGTTAYTNERVHTIDTEIEEILVGFNKTKMELEEARLECHASKDLENDLRSRLKDVETQLYNERKTVRETTQTHDAYNSLLRMSRDVLERAESKIDRQFEKEAEKEESKDVTAVVVNGN